MLCLQVSSGCTHYENFTRVYRLRFQGFRVQDLRLQALMYSSRFGGFGLGIGA